MAFARPASRAIYLQALGVLLLLASLALPSVNMLADHSWGPHGPVSGIRCFAMAPLIFAGAILRIVGNSWHANELSQVFASFCVGLSWLINLLLAFYIVSSRTARRRIALSILVCTPAAWLVFSMANMRPMVGYFAWVAGTFLILTPELLGESRPSDEQWGEE